MVWPSRHPGLPRNRYVPFRVLAMLQYGEHYITQTSGFMEKLPQGRLHVHSLAKLAKCLRMRSTDLRTALEWLHTAGYLLELEYHTGGAAARVSIKPPPNVR